MLFVTGVQYHPINVIGESLKSTEDVPMARPATYFVTVFKRLTSPNLPKNAEYLTIHNVICHRGAISSD